MKRRAVQVNISDYPQVSGIYPAGSERRTEMRQAVDNYIKNRENAPKRIVDGVDGPCSDYIERELNGIVLKDDDLTCDKKVTPSSLKDHLKQLLKKGNLHVGYLTTE